MDNLHRRSESRAVKRVPPLVSLPCRSGFRRHPPGYSCQRGTVLRATGLVPFLRHTPIPFVFLLARPGDGGAAGSCQGVGNYPRALLPGEP